MPYVKNVKIEESQSIEGMQSGFLQSHILVFFWVDQANFMKSFLAALSDSDTDCDIVPSSQSEKSNFT